jgi:hypothetical protein
VKVFFREEGAGSDIRPQNIHTKHKDIGIWIHYKVQASLIRFLSGKMRQRESHLHDPVVLLFGFMGFGLSAS